VAGFCLQADSDSSASKVQVYISWESFSGKVQIWAQSSFRKNGKWRNNKNRVQKKPNM